MGLQWDYRTTHPFLPAVSDGEAELLGLVERRPVVHKPRLPGEVSCGCCWAGVTCISLRERVGRLHCWGEAGTQSHHTRCESVRATSACRTHVKSSHLIY